jgi:sugar phosphate permease
MQVGYGLGGLAVPLVVYSLETFGWRATAFGSGVLIMCIGLPLSQLVRHRPEDYGLQVDGGPGANEARQAVTRRPGPDFRPREALRTRAFWLISLGHGSALLVVSAVTVHLVPHLHESLGYPLSTAGLVVSLMTLMQIIGIGIGGFLGDRFSKRLIAAGCLAGHATALLLVAYATQLPMVIGFAVVHGLAWGIRGPLMQSIRADYFGRAAFGVIVGLSSMITTFGNTLGPLVAGALAERTGRYETGLTLLALLAGLGSVFFLLATRPRPPLRPTDGGGRLADEARLHAGGDGLHVGPAPQTAT